MAKTSKETYQTDLDQARTVLFEKQWTPTFDWCPPDFNFGQIIDNALERTWAEGIEISEWAYRAYCSF